MAAVARVAHRFDPDCPACAPKPGSFQFKAAHEVREDSPAPYRNPHDGGDLWYHGTSFDPEEDEETAPRHGEDPGGRLDPEEAWAADAPDYWEDHRGYNQRAHRHWNSDLGTHFTSVHEVARKDFASAMYPQLAKTTSRVAHAQLHMANPRHYESEFDMDNEAVRWALKNGHPHHAVVDDTHVPEAELRRKPTAEHELVMHTPSEFAEHINNHGPMSGRPGANEQWLRHHPDRDAIVRGFEQHLRDQGHDGVTYGNEVEGPKRHISAIAFGSTPVTMRGWQWFHEKRQHLNPPGQDPREPLRFEHTQQATGKKDWPTLHTVKAQIPGTSVTAGYVRYWTHARIPALGVNFLYVLPGFRRRGIADRLMDEARRLHPDAKVVHGHFSPAGWAWWQRYEARRSEQLFTQAIQHTATDWHQFDTNNWYRWGHVDGAKGDVEERDRAQARVDVGRHDQHDVDYLVGHAAGTERARENAAFTHTVRQMWEAAPEYGSVEHQVNILGHEIEQGGHEAARHTAAVPQDMQIRYEPGGAVREGGPVNFFTSYRDHKLVAHVPHPEWPDRPEVRREVGSMYLDGRSDQRRGGHRVSGISVHPDYRRQGVATALWEHAQHLGLQPQHEDMGIQTPEGAAWAATTPEHEQLKLFGARRQGSFSTAFTAPGYDHTWAEMQALDRTAALHDISKPGWRDTWAMSEEDKAQAHQQHQQDQDRFHRQIAEQTGLPTTDKWELEETWKRGIRQALTHGKIDIGTARQRGYSGDAREMGEQTHDWTTGKDETKGGWRPMPGRVYHVGTDADAIAKEGLKTRRELGQQRGGVGLGGGTDDTVSVTSDHSLAPDIYHSLHEHHAYLTGKLSTDQLLDYAKYPPVGEPFHDRVHHALSREVIDGARRGVRTHEGIAPPAADSWNGNGHDPSEWQVVAHHPNPPQGMDPIPARWERPHDERENHEIRTEFYKGWSRMRQGAGGHRDPLFLSNDPHRFATEVNPARIGILHLHTRPGGQGYPLRASEEHHQGADSGEWRTAGSPFDVDHIERPTPRYQSEFGVHSPVHNLGTTAMGQAGPDYDNLEFDHHDYWGEPVGKWEGLEHAITAHHPSHGQVGRLDFDVHTWPEGPHRHSIEIGSLEVPSEHQRRGVASQLMGELERRYPDTLIEHGGRTERGRDWAESYYGPGATRDEVDRGAVVRKGLPTRNRRFVEAMGQAGLRITHEQGPPDDDDEGEWTRHYLTGYLGDEPVTGLHIDKYPNSPSGRVYRVWTEPAHQRRGYATALLNHARTTLGFPVEHARTEDQTRAGQAWAEKIGTRHTAMGAAGPDYEGLHFKYWKNYSSEHDQPHWLDGNDKHDRRSFFGMMAFRPGQKQSVGTVEFSPVDWGGGDREVHVHGVKVNEEHRRRGVGSALLNELERHYPDTPINHGLRTEQGEGLGQHLYGTESPLLDKPAHSQTYGESRYDAGWTLGGKPYDPTTRQVTAALRQMPLAEFRTLISHDHGVPVPQIKDELRHEHENAQHDARFYGHDPDDPAALVDVGAHYNSAVHGGPDAYIEHLKADIARHGITNPPEVADTDRGRLLSDGNHRAVAIHELGIDPVPVNYTGDYRTGHTAILHTADSGYGSGHMAPRGPDEGAPMHDIESVMPDVHEHPEYYRYGSPGEDESLYHIRRVRGNPEAKVRVYRALPAEHAHRGFQPGDWVSPSKEYARQHATQQHPHDDWPVIRTMVRAKELWNEGYPTEFGYSGEAKQGMVSHKGGRNQEVRQHADGVIRPVQRRKQASIGFPSVGAFMTGHDTLHPHCEYHEDQAREAAFAESPEVSHHVMFGGVCPHCEAAFPKQEQQFSDLGRHLVTHHGWDPDRLSGGRDFEYAHQEGVDQGDLHPNWKPATVEKQWHAYEHDTHDGWHLDEPTGDVHSHPPDDPHGPPVMHRQGWHGPHTAARRVLPHERVFGRTFGLDTRLWDGETLRPTVRAKLLHDFTVFCARHGYRNWHDWAKIHFFGSEASEWTSPTLFGNADFDTNVGINFKEFRRNNPQFARMHNQDIAAMFTDQMRHELNNPADTFPAVEGVWDHTWFANPDSWDIRKIRPYSAYDVTSNEWVVKPPHLPDWSLASFPKPVVKALQAAESYARDVLDLPEPQRTQQAAALFDSWHADRSRAFSPHGEGWWDFANLREKWLDQQGIWGQLVDAKHRDVAGEAMSPADWSNQPLWATARQEPDPEGPLPVQPDRLFYRLHGNERRFSPSDASSVPLGRSEILRARGYSAFDNPHDLHRYLRGHTWLNAYDQPDMEHARIIAFRGTRVGYGFDGEHLAVPDTRKDRTEYEIPHFLHRLEQTPPPDVDRHWHKPTGDEYDQGTGTGDKGWHEGNGADCRIARNGHSTCGAEHDWTHLDEGLPNHMFDSNEIHEPYMRGQKTAASSYEEQECEICGGWHATENHDTEGSHVTDWDDVWPHVSDLHRGINAHLPPKVHEVVHDPSRSEAERAHVLLAHFQTGHHGIHWTADRDQAEHYVTGFHGEQGTPVRISGGKPHRDWVEEDPHTLDEAKVLGYDLHDDREVPLQHNAPVPIHSVSWGEHGSHQLTHHHSFETPITVHAAKWPEGKPPENQTPKGALEEIGRHEHPNVEQYRSGGMGHLKGDEDRSVVGFMPTKEVAKYREHAGDWNRGSDEVVGRIRADIRDGIGIKTPLMIEYNHDEHWGYLGEGNHRLRAAEEEGLHTVPVRVVRSYYGPAKRKEKGIGAPMHLQTSFGNEDDPDYVPSDLHPHHFLKEAAAAEQPDETDLRSTDMLHDEHGSVRLHRVGPDEVFLSNLITAWDRRGQGHGSAMLRRLTDAADRQDLHLATVPGNDELRPWYERHGFQVDPEERGVAGKPYMRRSPVRKQAASTIWLAPMLMLGTMPVGNPQAVRTPTPTFAMQAIQRGQTAVLPSGDWDGARNVMQWLGMSPEEIRDRLFFAATGYPPGRGLGLGTAFSGVGG